MAISRASSSFAASATFLTSASAFAFTSAAALSTVDVSCFPHDASVAASRTVAVIDTSFVSFTQTSRAKSVG